MDPDKDSDRPADDDVDKIVKPGQDDQPQFGDVNSGGRPVDAAEQDPTPDQA